MENQEAKDAKSVKNVVTGEKAESQKNPNDLFLRLQADYVHATDLDTGDPFRALLRYASARRSITRARNGMPVSRDNESKSRIELLPLRLRRQATRS